MRIHGFITKHDRDKKKIYLKFDDTTDHNKVMNLIRPFVMRPMSRYHILSIKYNGKTEITPLIQIDYAVDKHATIDMRYNTYTVPPADNTSQPITGIAFTATAINVHLF